MCKTSDMEIKHDTKRLPGIVRNEIYESKDLKYVETFDDGNGIGMFYCKKKLYKKNETVLHRVRLFQTVDKVAPRNSISRCVFLLFSVRFQKKNINALVLGHL